MFKGLQIAQLDHEWLDTKILIINDQSSVDYSVRRKSAQVSRPKFCSRSCWGVDYKLISALVECGRRFYAGNVRTMAELSLSVATQNVALAHLIEPASSLLLVSHNLDSHHEHGVVES